MPISIPKFFQKAFAQNGGKQDVPITGDTSGGRASYDEGFPPVTRTPIIAGGIPPFGTDFNGVLYDITSAIQYIQAGRSFPYNQDFADAVGGYGKGSLVSLESDLSVVYKSKIDDNLTPPPGVNWDIQGVIPVPTNPIQGSFKNLRLSASGTSALTNLSADQIILENSIGDTKKLNNLSLSISTSSVGLNGLDTGSIASNTWYSVWVVNDGVNSGGLISLSSTSPALPSGYSYKAYVGHIRTDASANKFPLAFIQCGEFVQYDPSTGRNITNAVQVASAVAAIANTYVSLSSAVPPSAVAVDFALKLTAGTGGNAAASIYPRSSSETLSGGAVAPSGSTVISKTELMLAEQSACYWAVAVTASTGSAGLYVAGWRYSL